MLKIILHPNEILREKAAPIADPLNHDIQNLIREMSQTMIERKGVGLAAPQVGVSKRVVIIATSDGPLPLINPEILKFSKKSSIQEEGCLSIPNVWGTVKRPYSIEVQAISYKGESLRFNANGLFARVIQHEIDHLDGVLFIDKVIKYTKNQERN
ncbi:MAG: peptide deformylase [Parcubacteria group bacterium]|nr:peptide deformylase [Parcubacteria group bacterium]